MYMGEAGCAQPPRVQIVQMGCRVMGTSAALKSAPALKVAEELLWICKRVWRC